MSISLLWLLFHSRVSRLLKLTMTVPLMLLWLSSAPLTSNALVQRMETPTYVVDSLCLDEKVGKPVVVLGDDLNEYIASEDPYEVLSHESLSRLQHAVSLDNGRNTYFVLGGGQTSRKLSDFMALVLIERGVSRERIVRERLSLSTREHVMELLSLIEPSSTQPIVLVTSSLHMNRSVALFEAQGYRVCPSAAGSRYSRPAGWVGLLPYISGLNKTTAAWRELLATIKSRAESTSGL